MAGHELRAIPGHYFSRHAVCVYFQSNIASYRWVVSRRYWIIIIPVMAILLPMFVLPEIIGAYHYMQKQLAGKKAVMVGCHACPANMQRLMTIFAEVESGLKPGRYDR